MVRNRARIGCFVLTIAISFCGSLAWAEGQFLQSTCDSIPWEQNHQTLCSGLATTSAQVAVVKAMVISLSAQVADVQTLMGSLQGLSSQVAEVQASMSSLGDLAVDVNSLVGVAGTLSTPLTAISSFWTEELLYFFLGVGLAMVFVRAVGTRW